MNTKKFFIIEDHTVTNLGLQQLIQEKTGIHCCGYAFTKSEAEEKLDLLASSKTEELLPDIIILDLFLGKENGLELLKKIRTAYPSVKVLVYSMYSKPGIISIVLGEGAHGFVEKSAPESVLISAINNILNGETFVQQNLVSPLFTYKTMFDGLTKQEQKILVKILEQKTKSEIIEELNIVPRTLDNYLSRIFAKTGCKGIDELFENFAK
ncbi:MAG: response regulator transcription factor [Treponema sp.]|nr:response regulator transcription factor [Treponema sp.]